MYFLSTTLRHEVPPYHSRLTGSVLFGKLKVLHREEKVHLDYEVIRFKDQLMLGYREACSQELEGLCNCKDWPDPPEILIFLFCRNQNNREKVGDIGVGDVYTVSESPPQPVNYRFIFRIWMLICHYSHLFQAQFVKLWDKMILITLLEISRSIRPFFEIYWRSSNFTRHHNYPITWCNEDNGQ